MTNKSILIITDGIGHNTSNKFNAFKNATKPTYDYLFKNVPYSLINTHGEKVGLPKGQMGNSEVGHMTIGAGRVLYQDLVKINLAIKDNSIYKNKILNDTINSSNNLHIIGLVSDGGVHSHIDHIIAIINLAYKTKKKVYIHIITDGRDVNPMSAKKYLQKIIAICNENIKIATISGRFYAMDRDNRWERVEKAYNAIAFGIKSNNTFTKGAEDILEYLHLSYEQKIYDEFIEPTAFEAYNGVTKNDGIIFCNFRSDRMREITHAIANQNFTEFNFFYYSYRKRYDSDFNASLVSIILVYVLVLNS